MSLGRVVYAKLQTHLRLLLNRSIAVSVFEMRTKKSSIPEYTDFSLKTFFASSKSENEASSEPNSQGKTQASKMILGSRNDPYHGKSCPLRRRRSRSLSPACWLVFGWLRRG